MFSSLMSANTVPSHICSPDQTLGTAAVEVNAMKSKLNDFN
jgi:hypothetical protein